MRIRMGMAGGGEGAFIGEIHRAAARLDGEIDLVCGAFSSTPEVSRRTGAKLGLAPERVYGSWEHLLTQEALLPADSRMEFVCIVTPNDLHFPIAARALGAGFHVLSDKPATRTLAEARELAGVIARTRCCYALTYTYLGYPMVAEARARVLNGEIGAVRRLQVDYSQGWLSQQLETQGNRQALWRTDPERAGAGGCIGDIGVHAFNLAEYVSGLQVTQLCCDLGVTVPGRRLDDQAAAFLRFDNGARGILTASQISAGVENDLTLRIHGETGSLVWSHRDPSSLQLLSLTGVHRILRAGNDMAELHPDTRALCRTPAGHPEGFIEAFANLYRAFLVDIRSCGARHGASGSGARQASPATVSAAVRGMSFIDAMIRSNEAGQRWIALEG